MERLIQPPKNWTFTHAICREPSHSIVDGLRAVDTGTPDLEVFAGQPADYVAALHSTGAEVSALDRLLPSRIRSLSKAPHFACKKVRSMCAPARQAGLARRQRWPRIWKRFVARFCGSQETDSSKAAISL